MTEYDDERHYLPLSRLRSGGEIGINSRSTGTTQDIDTLAATIRAKGILQPLAVYAPDAEGDAVYVADGNRRLIALQMLLGQGWIAPSHLVPVHWIDAPDEASAYEASLITNIERVPLHPVDRYEAFAMLADKSRMRPADIAERFGLQEIDVRRALALGDLHPKIREAWRLELIEEEIARAYTVTTDQTLQIAAFHHFTQTYVYPADVKRFITGDVGLDDQLAFVGEAAYLEVGGRIGGDLFGEERWILDAPKLLALVAQKVDAQCAAIKEEGWAWAAPEPPEGNWRAVALPEPQLTKAEKAQIKVHDKAFRWDLVNAIKARASCRDLTPERKAELGVIVNLRGQDFYYRWGLERFEQEAATATAVGAKPEKPRYPQAILDRLRQDQTLTLAKLTGDRGWTVWGRDLFLASFVAASHCGSPMPFVNRGAPALRAQLEERWPQLFAGDPDFKEALDRVIGLSPVEAGVFLGNCIASLINVTTVARSIWSYPVRQPAVDAAVEIMGDEYLGAMHDALDLSAFFSDVPKSTALLDAAEAGVLEETIKRLAKLKKDAFGPAMAEAINEVATDWLPAPLRPAGEPDGDS